MILSMNPMSAYLATFTLAQSQAHNNVHEALLMNGYAWRFVPCHIEDDGDGESGPHITGHPPYFAYSREDEFVFTEHGEVKHREKQQPGWMDWVDEQQEAEEPEPAPKAKRRRRPMECTCADDDHCDMHPMDTPSLDPHGPWGPP